MNHPSPLHQNAHLFLLPVACAGLFTACAGGRGSGTDTPVAVVDTTEVPGTWPVDKIVEYDMSISSTHRQGNFNRTQLDSTRELFKNHFQIEDHGLKPLTNTVLRIPWDSIVKTGDAAVPTGKAAGIYFNYGVDGTAFHPIIRFVYQTTGGGEYQLSKANPYSYASGRLVRELHADHYEQAYKDNVRIDRLGNGTYTSLKLNDPKDSLEDPFSTWFEYQKKINELVKQNPPGDSTMLVVSCISEYLEYADLPAIKETPEYRHLLALHVGQGNKTDLLSNRPSKNPYPYKEHAMDMGTMCPPNCKP